MTSKSGMGMVVRAPKPTWTNVPLPPSVNEVGTAEFHMEVARWEGEGEDDREV